MRIIYFMISSYPFYFLILFFFFWCLMWSVAEIASSLYPCPLPCNFVVLASLILGWDIWLTSGQWDDGNHDTGKGLKAICGIEIACFCLLPSPWEEHTHVSHWFQEEDERHVEQSQPSAKISNHPRGMSNKCLFLCATEVSQLFIIERCCGNNWYIWLFRCWTS